MQQTIVAVYENCVLRPLQPLDWLEENTRVTVKFETQEQVHPLENCVGILPEEDAREMRDAIKEAFGKVNPDDWK